MSKNKKSTKKVSRRKFLIRGAFGTLGVLAVGTYLLRHSIRRSLADFANTVETPYLGDTKTPSIWFEFLKDNTVIFYSPKVEMGQGTFTGLAQIAADELDIDITQIKVVNAPSISGNMDDFATGGSTSISSLWQPLRELAATTREMIKNEAAKKLNTDASELKVEKGVIHHGDRSLTYAEAIEGVSEWKLPETPPLKDLASYQYVGKPVPRVDLTAKVFGEPIFGMDASMPGMLYGSVVRATQIGATYEDADISAVEKIPGVIMVVKEHDFVGVVAETKMAADRAKRAIKASWKTDNVWQTEDIEEMIKVGQGTPITIQKEGDASKRLSDSENTIIAEYQSPLGAHAQLEPNGAVAHVEDDKATIMISTQVVKITRDEIAKRLGMSKSKVNIIPTFLGGGFGRRLHTPNAIQAAVLSKAVGKPVSCFLDRQEEFQHDTFRPPTHHVLKASLQENGMIEAIEHHVSSGDVAFGSPMLPSFAPAIMGADLGAWRGGMINYSAIPNYKAVSWRVKLPFATSWWRSLGLLANTFAIESFMDELAEKAGKDPIQFRLDQIAEDERGYRLREVIKVAAEKAQYKNAPENGRAMGFACSVDVNTPCAQVAEVSIENNEIKVHKVTCVMDPGLVINPDQVRAQCEGAIIMGMSAAMYERMYVKDNELKPIIYGPYKMALMRHTPKEINVELIQNSETPGGVGEPPLGPIGAAIANAAYKLTGTRLRTMPLELS